MSRIRFATAQALFDTFPKSVTKIAAMPTDDSPVGFLKKLLEQEKIEDAVAFAAYLLPRRETIWWACGCTRMLLGDIAQDHTAGLLAAEEWVQEPDDEHRRAALAIGILGDRNVPSTWLALGAGWAGGFLLDSPQKRVSTPQYMTPRAARVAIVLSALGLWPRDRTTRLRACIAEGIRLAENGL